MKSGVLGVNSDPKGTLVWKQESTSHVYFSGTYCLDFCLERQDTCRALTWRTSVAALRSCYLNLATRIKVWNRLGYINSNRHLQQQVSANTVVTLQLLEMSSHFSWIYTYILLLYCLHEQNMTIHISRSTANNVCIEHTGFYIYIYIGKFIASLSYGWTMPPLLPKRSTIHL